jgi:endoglucanase
MERRNVKRRSFQGLGSRAPLRQIPFMRFPGSVCFLSAALTFSFSSPVIQAQERVPPERLAFLAHGINLNSWFTPWANPAGYATAFRREDADFLKRAGFTVCRLPLAPDLLFDPYQPSMQKAEIHLVDKAVRLLLDAGLAVVLDPIHGSSSDAEWERRLDHDPVFLGQVREYWEALARHFAGISSARIFFEVMNEPHLSAREKVDPAWWKPVQESLVAAVRRGAPLNTIVVTGERWGGIDGLLQMKPLADRNIVYSFHWYDPFTFTHQGAEWAGPVQAELAGIPYPSSPAAVTSVATALADPGARSQVLRYGEEVWNEERVKKGLARAADWAAANHVPLFCGEFGVYRKAAPAGDRLQWIGDVRRNLEAMGIGWCMWDYETDFGLVTYTEPGWRRGIQVDSGCLSALGLDATQEPEHRRDEGTVADFASGAMQSLDIPVDAWAKLWTRVPGVGDTSVKEDSSGGPEALDIIHRGSRDWALGSSLRIPVRPGEELALSSRGSVEGAGSLSLEAVARDASGNVIDWSYGVARVAQGPARSVVTRFLVSRGIATLEPRWSGSGPSLLHVEAFHLERLRYDGTNVDQ